MKKQKFPDYYLGLDIGTSSVGWCVTDLNYNVLRFNKKDMWGSRLFNEAKTATERRIIRNSRRRLKRRKARLNLLKDFFFNEISKNDPNFFIRLKESPLWLSDKSLKEKYMLFNDENYKDSDFHKEYPTIFHLRKELVTNPEKKDIRLVYLAIHNIFKNRGHFLFEGQNLDEIKNIETLFDNLINFFENNDIEKTISKEQMNKLKTIICSDKRNLKEKQIKEMFENDKQLISFFKLCVGSSVSLNDLFNTDEYKKGEVDKDKISFKEQIYEDDKPVYFSILNEKIELLDIAKSFYDYMILTDILGNSQYISEAKVKTYEDHKKELQNLKYIIKKYQKEDYNYLFKNNSQKNYSSYVHLNKKNGKKNVITEKRIKNDELMKIIKNSLQKIEKVEVKDEKILNEILEKIERNSFLIKQRIVENGTLPYQIHEIELRKILENQSKYYEFLNLIEDGISIKEKILMTFKFKIPYYVGVLNSYHQNKGGNSWAVRKEEGKIYAWNFEQKVDIEKSAEEFIKRMTNKCTYLNGEDVIPKDSLLYSEFTILNELNKVQINNVFLSKIDKEKIINNLFKNNKKITEKKFKEYLFENNFIDKKTNIELKGIKDVFNSNYANYIKFKDIFAKKIELATYKEISEKSILWKCLYGDDKKIFERKIKSEYGDILTDDEIKKINSLKFNTWGRLSEKFLTEIEFINLETGECYSSVMDALRRTNYNLMELLTYNFTLQENINKENKNDNNNFSYKELIENSYVSPALKRAIFQTLNIYEEIKKITGKIPKKVFIEMARGGDETMKNKKIPARKEQINKLYKSCGKELSDFSVDLNTFKKSLEAQNDNTLKQKKLYLYFLQFGKCMYSGVDIDLDKLLKNNDAYDIDHIYPRSKIIKDDSFNNIVLVLKEENAKKSDKFPIETKVQNKMKKYWNFLKNNNFITEEKYKRLTATSKFELEGFMARQLVNVRQTTKEIGKILEQTEPNLKIVYSKAEIVTSFREMFDFIKVRELNNTHHAKDAYLNIVTGNVYNTKFTEKFYLLKNKKENEKYNYDVKKIYNYNITNAWDKEKSLEIVKKNMEKNTVNITRAIKEQKGQFFNVTILKKNESSNEIIPINPKKYTKDLKNLNVKYGYYGSLNPAYFLYVEHEVKNNKIKSFERINMVDVKKIKTEKDLIEHLINVKGLVNPKIIKKIYKEQCIIIDGFPYLLTGLKSDKKLEFNNNKILYLDRKYEKILKNVINFIENNKNAIDENYKFTFLKKKNNFQKHETIEEVKKRYELEFNEMYDEFLRKLNSKEYKNYINNKKYQELSNVKEKFIKLNLFDKAFTLKSFLDLFNKKTIADFSKVGLTKFFGKIHGISSNVLSKNELYLLEESVTGLFTKKIKL